MSKHYYVVGYDTELKRWSCAPEHDEHLRGKVILNGSRGWVTVEEAGERLKEVDEKLGENLELGMRFLNYYENKYSD